MELGTRPSEPDQCLWHAKGESARCSRRRAAQDTEYCSGHRAVADLLIQSYLRENDEPREFPR